MVEFFPKDRRLLLSKVLAKLKKLQRMAMKAVELKLDGPALEKQMQQALAELDEPGNSSGSSPESSTSTPAPLKPAGTGLGG